MTPLIAALLASLAGAAAFAAPNEPDLAASARSGRLPEFGQLLDARFGDPKDTRYESFAAWARKITPEEEARWYRADGVGPDGKPRWKAVVPCATFDSRGPARAMIAVIGIAPDRATAERRWREVERAYAAAPVLEESKLAVARKTAAARPTAIGKELAIRVARDQAWREAQFDREHDDATQEAIAYRLGSRECHVDTDDTRWLKGVVDDGGWPLVSRDGKGAAHDAWLLAQHADGDRAFQARVLALLEPLVAKKEASGRDYALLVDRVAVAEDRPQRYATQFTEAKGGGCLMASDTEDPAHVDARRRAVGLSSIARYARRLSKAYHKPACANLFSGDGR